MKASAVNVAICAGFTAGVELDEIFRRADFLGSVMLFPLADATFPGFFFGVKRETFASGFFAAMTLS